MYIELPCIIETTLWGQRLSQTNFYVLFEIQPFSQDQSVVPVLISLISETLSLC